MSNNDWAKALTLIGISACVSYCTLSLSKKHSSGDLGGRARRNPTELKSIALGRVILKLPDRIPEEMLKRADQEAFIHGIVYPGDAEILRCGIYYKGFDSKVVLVGFMMPREVEPKKWTIDAIYIEPRYRGLDIASQAVIQFYANREASFIKLDKNDIVGHQVFGRAGFILNTKPYVDPRTSLIYNKWIRNPYIAVIIKDSPYFVEGSFRRVADAFYNQMVKILDEKGYSIIFDGGYMNEPLPDAELWIAHGNGEQKLHKAVRNDKRSDRDVIFISDFSDASEAYQKALKSAAASSKTTIDKLGPMNRPIPPWEHFETTRDLRGVLRSM